MVDQIIRPSALPRRTNPVASEVVPVDNGTSVAGSTLAEIVDAGRPVASRAEAEAGTNAEKAMTPLTVDQKIEYEIGRSLASKAQGDLADTAVQPGDLATVATTGDYDDLTNLPVIPPGIEDGDKGDITVSGSGTVWTIDDEVVTEPKLADGAVSTRALAPEAVTIEKLADAVLARMDASRPSQGRARVDYWTTSAIAAFVPAALAMNGFRMFGNNYKYGQPVFSTGGAGRKVVSIINNIAYENIATKLNWYALFAVANEGDATCSFVLAPFLRVFSVAGNVVTLGGGAANQNATPVTKTYDMDNDVLVGTDCLIINQGANWNGRVTTVTANTDSTVTLDDATGLVQLNFLLPAPPGWDHYVYLGSVYHENGSSAIGGDFRNIADSGSKVLSRMVNAGEYPTGGTVSPVKVRLGGEISPLAAGVICSPNGTLSTSSSGSVAVQLWHDGNNHDVFRMLAVKEGASNLGFNAMAEVTFSKEQAFHVAFSGTLASQIASGSCLVYGWIEP